VCVCVHCACVRACASYHREILGEMKTYREEKLAEDYRRALKELDVLAEQQELEAGVRFLVAVVVVGGGGGGFLFRWFHFSGGGGGGFLLRWFHFPRVLSPCVCARSSFVR
jgi:hypothetical protein